MSPEGLQAHSQATVPCKHSWFEHSVEIASEPGRRSASRWVASSRHSWEKRAGWIWRLAPTRRSSHFWLWLRGLQGWSPTTLLASPMRASTTPQQRLAFPAAATILISSDQAQHTACQCLVALAKSSSLHCLIPCSNWPEPTMQQASAGLHILIFCSNTLGWQQSACCCSIHCQTVR